MVADDVFIIESLHGDVGEGVHKRDEFRRRLVEPAVCASQFPDFLKIIFFGIRLIENMKLLIAEIHASEAILASFAVIAKIAVGAVDDVAREIAIIRIQTIHAFIAKFGFFRERAIGAVAASSHPETVIAILAAYKADNPVAIFSGSMVRTKIGVFTARGENCRMWP